MKPNIYRTSFIHHLNVGLASSVMTDSVRIASLRCHQSQVEQSHINCTTSTLFSEDHDRHIFLQQLSMYLREKSIFLTSNQLLHLFEL